jgi:hypothetical protein
MEIKDITIKSGDCEVNENIVLSPNVRLVFETGARLVKSPLQLRVSDSKPDSSGSVLGSHL